MSDIRNYRELIGFTTFTDRLEYLMLRGQIGSETFGGLRQINQRFYKSQEWLAIRDKIIIRDGGCDLGIQDQPILGYMCVHHIIPITPDILRYEPEMALGFDNLVLASVETHQLIHYAREIPKFYFDKDRKPGDTTLW